MLLRPNFGKWKNEIVDDKICDSPLQNDCERGDGRLQLWRLMKRQKKKDYEEARAEDTNDNEKPVCEVSEATWTVKTKNDHVASMHQKNSQLVAADWNPEFGHCKQHVCIITTYVVGRTLLSGFVSRTKVKSARAQKQG